MFNLFIVFVLLAILFIVPLPLFFFMARSIFMVVWCYLCGFISGISILTLILRTRGLIIGSYLFFILLVFLILLFFLEFFFMIILLEVFQYIDGFLLLETLGISFLIGVDGLSLIMLGLTAFLFPLCYLISWESVVYKRQSFFVLLSILTAIIIFSIFAVGFINFLSGYLNLYYCLCFY